MQRKEQGLRALPLFAGCNSRELRWVARVADVVDLPAGTALAVAGHTPNEFVVVVDGLATASNDRIAFGPGSYFGHVGIAGHRPHDVTVEARTAVRAIVIERRAFLGMLERAPSVARKLLSDLATQIRVEDKALAVAS